MIGALEEGVAWFLPVIAILVLFVWTDRDTRDRRRRRRAAARADRALRSIQ